jgi:putative nucleotidyltransferase with HDIG domain
MKRLPTSQLVPGMIASQDVLSIDHQMIFPKDTVLTDKLISKLEMYAVVTVYVKTDEPLTDTIDRMIPTEPSYSTWIKSTEEFKVFQVNYETEVDSFKKAMNEVVSRNCDLNVYELLQDALAITAGSTGKISILDMLQNMRNYDDTTFAHCLNVGLICNVFSKWLKLAPDQTELATACGLFHDIGKLLVPNSIITKPGKLSDLEFMEVKKHPQMGYQLLYSKHVADHICNAALMHHERCDGSGYPLRLKREQIDNYAKIVAIADVYDAMTAARVYRGPMCPFHVIEIFESDGIQKYDVHYVMTFLENVASTYLHNRCRLTDGRVGDIVFINKNQLSRPVIHCGNDYVDLAIQPEVSVECLL